MRASVTVHPHKQGYRIVYDSEQNRYVRVPDPVETEVVDLNFEDFREMALMNQRLWWASIFRGKLLPGTAFRSLHELRIKMLYRAFEDTGVGHHRGHQSAKGVACKLLYALAIREVETGRPVADKKYPYMEVRFYNAKGCLFNASKL